MKKPQMAANGYERPIDPFTPVRRAHDIDTRTRSHPFVNGFGTRSQYPFAPIEKKRIANGSRAVPRSPRPYGPTGFAASAASPSAASDGSTRTGSLIDSVLANCRRFANDERAFRVASEQWLTLAVRAGVVANRDDGVALLARLLGHGHGSAEA